ncbi:MAG: TIGR02206 family membrane protein [Anaerolineae bacterium]|nr:TIGR02206 family membrane protein [Anaerolineae bacterium]MDK1082169.1 TIGR02206 family membrane protein [Anaerolineae bacterium]
MSQFFAKDYLGGEFEFLGVNHIFTLTIIILINFIILRYKRTPEDIRSKVRWFLAILLWTNEIGFHIWKINIGEWHIQTMLPLHVCSLLVWLSGLMLVTKSFKIYEFVYFIGIGGAIQVLVTPDLGIYGFPHYRYFQTFISHGFIIISAIYMTTVEAFRPTWSSFFRVVLWLNVYMLAIFFLNNTIGSNYLMVNHKPSLPSLLDLLPDWPWYILWMELIGLVTFLLLYSPFIIKDLRSKKTGTIDEI